MNGKRHFKQGLLLGVVVVLWPGLPSCHHSPPLPVGKSTPITYFTAQTTDNTFHTADHFMASIEMQISGEPFAQLLGRNLAGYNRFTATTDLYYTDAPTDSPSMAIVDPLGYSMAIESYEYSKQPMNNTSFESGAGLSLQYGPLLNPSQVTGDAAFALLRDRLQHFAAASSTAGSWVVSPAPTDNPLNVYGWPGYFPVFAEFQSFNPEIAPAPGSDPPSGDAGSASSDGGAIRTCSITGGYAASIMGAELVGPYECGYNSLNLLLRDLQVTKVLDPAALGFALWKQGLWTINYWQSLHDLMGNGITAVADADLASVGQPGNTVIGRYPDPTDPTGVRMLGSCDRLPTGVACVPGVYLGDIPLEGWQGLTMLEEMHNKSAFALTRMLTSDGATLGGFTSTAQAMAYDYQSSLKWWPAEIAVTEAGTTAPPAGQSWKYFPQPVSYTVMTPSSSLRGLLALAGGMAEFFALTDFNNPAVGALPSSRATFDGDPFPADDQLPDGEDSPHDRALANIKVAVVNMDRIHYDPNNHVMVDSSTVSGGKVQYGTVVSALTCAYSIVGLRTALRSISSSLTLYSNDTPDVMGGTTALDGAPLTGPSGVPTPIPQRMTELIVAQADFMAAKLVAADGSVANFYDLAAGKPDSAPTELMSEAAAIRGLLDAYLATSDNRYREIAMLVYSDLDRRFWMSDVRAYRTTAGESNTLTYTPAQFGTIQGALRQYWKLVANEPGKEELAAEILERVQRENKLVANGWDDANADNLVQYPDECTGAGLQMAERALTGELSHPADNGDRDHDCVLEISAAKLPSALAGQIVLQRR